MKHIFIVYFFVFTFGIFTSHGLLPNDVGSRIFNGEEAVLGQFPWQASLNFVGDQQSWGCSGAIISENFILTAGHCLFGAVIGTAVTGSINLNDGNEYNFYNTFIPDEFDLSSLTDDIGLLQVIPPIQFDNNTAAVSIFNETIDDGTEMTVSGWGLTSDDDGSIGPLLNYVNVVTIPNSECKKSYGDRVQDSMICSTGKNGIKGICFGDSGSPAVINIDGKSNVAAVASFVSDNGCEIGDPNGFTRIAPYREWIKDISGI